MSWAAIAAAVIGAGASAGVAAASAPTYPNPAASSRRVALAQLRALPGQRLVDIAARMGREVDYPTGKLLPIARFGNKTVAQALQDGDITRALKAGQITQQQFSDYLSGRGQVLEMAHADFRGHGDADIQGALAKQGAQSQLDLSRKYGDQFIASAKAQEAAADPAGTAARHLLASEINRGETERLGATHPVADRLDTQILSELQAGKGTSADTQKAVGDVLAQRAAAGTGGSETSADVQNQMESGPEGQARLQARMQKALSYLSSGATPEDVDYRRRQTSLANMASFLQGRTPQAQFQQLSGGQQGATPSARGPAIVGPNPNIQQLGQQAGVTAVNLGAQANQQNASWFSGLSSLAHLATVAGAAYNKK